MLALFTFGVVSGDKYRGSAEDLVVENLGIKVERVGDAAETKERILISLVIRLPEVRKILSPKGNIGDKLMECRNLVNVFTFHEHARETNENNRRVKSMIKTLFASLTGRINTFLESRTKILEAYKVVNSTKLEKHKQKRGIFPLVLGAGISLAIGGITEYQIYRMNKHVAENTKTIEKMKLQVTHMDKEIEILDNKVIGFVNDITRNLEAHFERFECIHFLEALTQRLTNDMLDSMKVIDNILWTALSGANNLLLTPRMIGVDTLENIVSRNTILNGTIFYDHPNLLYSLATVHLLELVGELELAHLILDIPLVRRGEHVNIFRSAQVGLSVNEVLCIYYDLPQYMYLKEGILYDFSLKDCKKHNNLHICSPDNFSNVTSCVQRQGISCGLRRSKCRNYYQYDMSQVGIIIRNNKRGDTFVISHRGLARILEMSSVGTAYISWDKVYAVQIGNSTIRAPNLETIPVYPNSLMFQFPKLEYFLDTANVTDTLSGICRKYNASLEDLLPPLVDHWVTASKYGAGGVGVVTIGLGILTLLLGTAVIVIYVQLRTITRKMAGCERVFRLEDFSEDGTGNIIPSRLPRCQSL